MKSEAYARGDVADLSIVTQREPAKHREIRRNLSHAFSAMALRTQTDVVLLYVGMFVDQLKRFGNTEEGIIANEVH